MAGGSQEEPSAGPSLSLEIDYEAAAFWAYQAAQFALKALFFHRGVYPPKKHSQDEQARGLDLKLDEQGLAELSPYYAVSGHPDAFGGVPAVHERTSARLNKVAEGVVSEVGAELGRGA